jgi:nucleoside-diphosphate-sugar epimerase
MMGRHVIVGSGPVGISTAEHLLKLGHEVRMVTRTGTGPSTVEKVAADATDAERLASLAAGADALYNCASPPYHRWSQLWPPLAAALLSAAERSGTVLVTMSNLYGYGKVAGPITEDLPLAATTPKLKIRADMWRAALAAHQAGRVRVTEARASDFLGPGAKTMFAEVIVPAIRRGTPALVPAPVDLPHSFTYLGDVGRTLAVLGTDPRALGRAWHVPTPEPVTLRDLALRLADMIGAPPPRLRIVSAAALRLVSLFNTDAREFAKVRHQFDRPWVLDSRAAQQAFGLAPTPLDDALRSMVSVS